MANLRILEVIGFGLSRFQEVYSNNYCIVYVLQHIWTIRGFLRQHGFLVETYYDADDDEMPRKDWCSSRVQVVSDFLTFNQSADTTTISRPGLGRLWRS